MRYILAIRTNDDPGLWAKYQPGFDTIQITVGTNSNHETTSITVREARELAATLTAYADRIDTEDERRALEADANQQPF
jgi:hypothetical protein